MNRLAEMGKNFVELHKNSDLNDWHNNLNYKNDEAKYKEIHGNLFGGLYGHVEEDINEDDNCIDCSIEISGCHSHSGNPIIFEFEADIY